MRGISIEFYSNSAVWDDLLVFYHPETLRQLYSLRYYLVARETSGAFDSIDAWIQMVAINRLAGHSKGFSSVYTLPPNQAVTVASQRKINARLQQQPEFRSVPDLILAKTKRLLRDITPALRNQLFAVSAHAQIISGNCERVPALADDSIDLVVIAFEVGELQRGKVRLEEYVIPAGINAGLTPVLVLINTQTFTKTANCWGVSNNDLGTNTNRVVKEDDQRNDGRRTVFH